MRRIFTIDAHAAGEPCRMVHAGVDALMGATMAARRRAFRHDFDWVRTGLTHEPRGHIGMFGALITPPVNAGSAYGLIFFDPVGYMNGCGHGTLCSVAAWHRIQGALTVPFGIDNPDNSVTRVLSVDGDDEHSSIGLAMPPATVLADSMHLPSMIGVEPAVVHCGNTFLIAEAQTVGISDLRTAGSVTLQGLALDIRESAQSAPHGIRNSGFEVLLWQEVSEDERTFATFVLFNGSQVDRSPCGTGSAALTALLTTRRTVRTGEPIRTVGPAGGYFGLQSASVGPGPRTVDVLLHGTAHITGIHEWIFSDDDVLMRGYLPV